MTGIKNLSFFCSISFYSLVVSYFHGNGKYWKKIELNNATECCLPVLLILLNEWELKADVLTKLSSRKKVGNFFIGQYISITFRCWRIKSEVGVSCEGDGWSLDNTKQFATASF